MMKEKSRADRMTPVGRRMFLYHTVCEVVLYEYEGNGGWLLDQCEKLAVDVQNMLNIFDPGSELSQMNRAYKPGVDYPLSQELFKILKYVNDFSALCEGAFDMTVGALVGLWNFTAAAPAVPSRDSIVETKAHTGFKKLAFHEETCSVNVAVPGMVLDGGGFGKGYGVGLVADFLKEHGVKSAAINFGGNLYVLGTYREDGGAAKRWGVGIQKPWQQRGVSCGTLYLSDLGVATSAEYDRYFKADGRVYHHIINPATGYPVETKLESISIISDIPVMTDLMSTAFFIMGMEQGERTAEVLRKNMVLEYVAVLEGRIIVSKGLSRNFVFNSSSC